jgi:hypothetical protein
MKCPNCGKQIANDSMFCEWCGIRVLDEVVSPVTILGYAETFAWNPSVSIYQDGVQIGTVAHNGRIELRIPQQCELQFKCNMRSAKCIVSPGDWILLSFDRMSGRLNATLTNKYNAQPTINQIKKNNSKWWVWFIVVNVLSFLLMIASGM